MQRLTAVFNDIIDAIASGDVVTVRHLLSHFTGDEINKCRDFHRRTLLHRAAMIAEISAQLNYMEAIIDRGASLQALDYRGNTPLHLAASSARPEAALLLISKGAPICMLNDDGNSPLDIAIAKGHSLLVDVLCERRCSVDYVTLAECDIVPPIRDVLHEKGLVRVHCYFDLIPDEVVLSILEHVYDGVELARMGLTCKRFWNLCTNVDALWHAQFCRRFADSANFFFSKAQSTPSYWRRMYAARYTAEIHWQRAAFEYVSIPLPKPIPTVGIRMGRDYGGMDADDIEEWALILNCKEDSTPHILLVDLARAKELDENTVVDVIRSDRSNKHTNYGRLVASAAAVGHRRVAVATVDDEVGVRLIVWHVVCHVDTTNPLERFVTMVDTYELPKQFKMYITGLQHEPMQFEVQISWPSRTRIRDIILTHPELMVSTCGEVVWIHATRREPGFFLLYCMRRAHCSEQRLCRVVTVAIDGDLLAIMWATPYESADHVLELWCVNPGNNLESPRHAQLLQEIEWDMRLPVCTAIQLDALSDVMIVFGAYINVYSGVRSRETTKPFLFPIPGSVRSVVSARGLVFIQNYLRKVACYDAFTGKLLQSYGLNYLGFATLTLQWPLLFVRTDANMYVCNITSGRNVQTISLNIPSSRTQPGSRLVALNNSRLLLEDPQHLWVFGVDVRRHKIHDMNVIHSKRVRKRKREAERKQRKRQRRKRRRFGEPLGEPLSPEHDIVAPVIAYVCK